MKNSSSQESDTDTKLDIHLKVLTGFMVVALLAAIYALSRIDQSSVFALEEPGYLFAALAAQLLLSLYYALVWRSTLIQCHFPKISFHEALLQSGIAFLGKYIPGKVGGLVMRGWTAHRSNPEASSLIKATTIEQAGLGHSGLVICFLVWAYQGQSGMRLTWLLLVAASFLVVVFSSSLANLLKRWCRKYPKIVPLLDAFGSDFQRPYYRILILLFIMWLLTAVTLHFCLLGFGVSVPAHEVLYMTCLSYIAGVALIFLPAGIGAREGMLVFLLGPYCPTSTALAIAGIYRLTTIFLDLAFGSYALGRYYTRG
ncbi:MAG: hypothetical protein DHS20C12_28940 [Pseudohongiella sp.]|nr:MAG: hypothetical protein DHS20C12_28940 [Pseudohongiella sp.]